MTARRRLGVLVLAVLGLAGCRPSMTEFVSKEGNYAVKLPGTPRHETRSTRTMWGDVPLQVETARGGPAEFTAMYNDMPRMLGPWSGHNEWLGGAVEGDIEQLAGTLKDRREIKLYDHPGLEIVVDVPSSKIPGGGRYEARIFVVGQRLYRVAVVAPAAQFPAEQAREFLDSFALLDYHGRPIRSGAIESVPVAAAPPAPEAPPAAPAAPEFTGGSFARP